MVCTARAVALQRGGDERNAIGDQVNSRAHFRIIEKFTILISTHTVIVSKFLHILMGLPPKNKTRNPYILFQVEYLLFVVPISFKLFYLNMYCRLCPV